MFDCGKGKPFADNRVRVHMSTFMNKEKSCLWTSWRGACTPFH